MESSPYTQSFQTLLKRSNMCITMLTSVQISRESEIIHFFFVRAHLIWTLILGVPKSKDMTGICSASEKTKQQQYDVFF